MTREPAAFDPVAFPVDITINSVEVSDGGLGQVNVKVTATLTTVGPGQITESVTSVYFHLEKSGTELGPYSMVKVANKYVGMATLIPPGNYTVKVTAQYDLHVFGLTKSKEQASSPLVLP